MIRPGNKTPEILRPGQDQPVPAGPQDFLYRLASAIATAEGWFHPDPRVPPRANNNPGNIIDPKTGKFRSFSTPEEGIAWLYFQIALDIRRGLTLRGLVTKWAPPTENDTERYIRETARRLGLSLSGSPPDTDRLWSYLSVSRIP